MSRNIIPYSRQNIVDEDIEEVVKVLRGDFLTQGPAVKSFENKFATYVNSKFAVAVSNGTAALHLSAMALGVNTQTNVITTPITFAASANCIRYCGGNIFFVDIDPNTALIDIDNVKKLIESKPNGFFSGIIPVDFAGQPVDLEKIKEIATHYDLWILEDACHAPGGYFWDNNNQKQYCGNGYYAELAIFSFHPVKHIACGEGGMITTNDENLYKKLLSLRTHGITKNIEDLEDNHGGWYYEMHDLGYNYRLSDIHASLGLSQLKQVVKNLEKRHKIAQRYDEVFKNNQKIKLLITNPKTYHAYHLYIIMVKDRLALYEFLRKHNIFAQIHYIPIYKMPYYKKLGYSFRDYPNTEAYYHRCLSLPMYPSLSKKEQFFVIEKVLEFVG